MAGIDCIAEEARYLGDSILRNVATYEMLIDKMGVLIKGLNAGGADEKYDQVMQSVTAMRRNAKTINENLMQVINLLRNYEEYLKKP